MPKIIIIPETDWRATYHAAKEYLDAKYTNPPSNLKDFILTDEQENAMRDITDKANSEAGRRGR